MFIKPTYTSKQYWFTVLIAGILIGVLNSIVYFYLYCYLYVPRSFVFSIIYLLPLLGATLTIIIFNHKFVWKEFTYGACFSMSLLICLLSALLFSLILFLAYNYFLDSRIDLFESVDDKTLQKLMTPEAISLSMFFINIILSLSYSLIIAIFAKRKIKE